MILAPQTSTFLIFFVFGLISALSTEIINTTLTFFNNNKILRFLTDLIVCFANTFLFVYLINKFNFGSYRIFLIFSYLSSFILEKISIGKLFAKFNKWLYNILKIKRKNFFNSKLGKFLSK